MPLTFRTAGQADVHTLVNLLSDAARYKLAHDDYSWGDANATAFDEAEVTRQLSEGITFIAELDRIPIGLVKLQWEDTQIWGKQPPVAGYIHRLAVASDYHGQKIGEQIIDFIAGQVEASQRHYVRLDCIADNNNLRAYYEKLGFELVHTYQTDVEPHRSALYQRPVST